MSDRDWWATLDPVLRGFLHHAIKAHRRSVAALPIGGNGGEEEEQGPSDPGRVLRDHAQMALLALDDTWSRETEGRIWEDPQRAESLIASDARVFSEVSDVLETLANPPQRILDVVPEPTTPDEAARMQSVFKALRYIRNLSYLLELDQPTGVILEDDIPEMPVFSRATQSLFQVVSLSAHAVLIQGLNAAVTFQPWTTVHWQRALVLWAYAKLETALTGLTTPVRVRVGSREVQERVASRLLMMLAGLGADLVRDYGVTIRLLSFEEEELDELVTMRKTRQKLRSIVAERIRRLHTVRPGARGTDVDSMIRTVARLLQGPPQVYRSLRERALERLLAAMLSDVDTSRWGYSFGDVWMHRVWSGRAASQREVARLDVSFGLDELERRVVLQGIMTSRQEAWLLARVVVAIAAGWTIRLDTLTLIGYGAKLGVGQESPASERTVTLVLKTIANLGMATDRQMTIAALLAVAITRGAGDFNPRDSELWREFYLAFVVKRNAPPPPEES